MGYDAVMHTDIPLIPDLGRNDRRVLGLLFRHRALTQSGLVEQTQLTQQSVSRILARLGETGLVGTGGRVSAEGRRGYPSTALSLRPEHGFSLGIAVLAGRVSMVISDFSGATCAQKGLSLNPVGVSRTLEAVDDALDDLCGSVGYVRTQLTGIGIAVSGSFIAGGGFNTPTYLEEWAGIDVERLFADRFGVIAIADNDGNAAAVAESQFGVGRWADSFAYLYISAGVGGGVILDGEPWRGRHGNAGEFAGGLPPHIFPFPNLELLRQLVVRDGVAFDTVDAMVQRFDAAWPAIEDWIARVKDSLSIIASNATAILDVDAIVLGGQMPTELAQRVIPHIDLFDQKRRSVPRPVARIVPAEARGEVAAIGASLLPLKRLFFGAE